MLGIVGQIAVTMALVVASTTSPSADSLPAADDLAPNTVALVSEMTPGKGTITAGEFRHELELKSVAQGRRSAPGPGADGYAKLMKLSVDSLLEGAWLRGQAAEWGIAVGRREVKREVARIKRENFKSGAEYREFLRQAHFTPRDVYERVELQLLAAGLQRTLARQAGEQAKTRKDEQRFFARFVKEFEERWRARTVCAAGYVTERCSNGPPPSQMRYA